MTSLPFDAELEAIALATADATAVWMSCALAAEVAAALSAFQTDSYPVSSGVTNDHCSVMSGDKKACVCHQSARLYTRAVPNSRFIVLLTMVILLSKANHFTCITHCHVA